MAAADKWKQYLKDSAKSGLFGLILSAGAGMILFLGGILFSGGSPYHAAQTTRSGLLIFTGLTLFVLAGMLLLKKGGIPEKGKDAWKKQFKELSPAQVLAVFSAAVLAVTVAVDYLVYYFA